MSGLTANYVPLFRNAMGNAISRTLEGPGGDCLWTCSGTFGGARTSLQISNEKTDGWYEMDVDNADGALVLRSPIWIEPVSLRVEITNAGD